MIELRQNDLCRKVLIMVKVYDAQLYTLRELSNVFMENYMTKQSILFSLRCDFPSGGCIKVRDYYHHAQHATQFTPQIYLPSDTPWSESNPWWTERHQIQPEYRPDLADILFISGLGWERFIPMGYRENSPIPIIYLIQGLFKLRPEYPHYQHLFYKAIRISVSQTITETIQQQKIKLNGPIFTISNCIDTAHLPQVLPFSQRDIGLLILGLKRPEYAEKLSQRLRPYCRSLVTVTQRLPQKEFHALMNRAQHTLFLPAEEEGFYLPALEGMALGTVVICPDVGGNRDFCHANRNCLLPIYHLDSIFHATIQALTLLQYQRETLLMNAQLTVQNHKLEKERTAFLEILHNLNRIW